MTKKLNVLHLIDSGGLYGAENVIINLSKGLNARKIKNTIGCFTYKNKKKPAIGMQAESMGLDCIYFQLSNKFDLTCTMRIASYCKENHVTLIHSHGYKPSLVCLLLHFLYKIPYVITCHLWFVTNKRLLLYIFLEKISMFFAKKVIGVSETIVNHLKNGGVPGNQLTLIENGIDVDSYTMREIGDERKLRNELGLKKSSILIGSLGRLTEQKDYKTFVKGAAEVLMKNENVEFIIGGDGHLRTQLETQCKELGIDNNFHILGFRNDSSSILKLMDIFVLSSLDEGLPMAMLEGMAAGVPVVVTPVGGIPNVIDNGVNGILFDKGNHDQLKDVLIQLINDGEKRQSLGKNAYDTVKKHYSIDRMTDEYIEVYNEAIR